MNPKTAEMQSAQKDLHPIQARFQTILEVDVLDWGGGAWFHMGEWDIRQFKAVEIGEVIEWGKGVGQSL